MTACGNFGIGSSSTGDIYMWNMQSGMKRKSFNIGPCPPEVVDRFRPSTNKGSERCVTGLETDSLNTVVIAATLDGTINVRFSFMLNSRLGSLIVAIPQFFDFHTTKLEHTLVLPSTAVSILLHRDSGLLAVVCDDMVVRIVDIETRRIVRELGGFRGRVLDIVGYLAMFLNTNSYTYNTQAFSPDSRWLVTTSLDSIIRTYDVPTGRLIDAFRTSSVATTIAFSPTNDFLATAHVDSVGIYLW